MTRIRLIDYFLCFIFVGISGQPYLSRDDVAATITVFALFLLFFQIAQKKIIPHFDRYTLLLFGLVLGYEIIHAFIFSNFKLTTFIRIASYLVFSWLFFNFFGKRFFIVYVLLIYYLTIVGFGFYLLYYINGPVELLSALGRQLFPLKSNSEISTLLIYTFLPNAKIYGIIRNSGFMWEPGAYAVYLSIALYFSLFILNNIKKRAKLFNKFEIVLLIGLISTFSTAGYIVTAVILVFYFYLRGVSARILMIPLLLLIFSIIFSRSGFMKEKITSQFETMETGRNRFAYVLIDYEYVRKRPLLGWGRKVENRYTKKQDKYFRFNSANGLMHLLVSHGIIYFLLYFYYAYKGIGHVLYFKLNEEEKVLKLSQILFLSLLLMNGFSQSLFDRPFFKSMYLYNSKAFDN